MKRDISQLSQLENEDASPKLFLNCVYSTKKHNEAFEKIKMDMNLLVNSLKSKTEELINSNECFLPKWKLSFEEIFNNKSKSIVSTNKEKVNLFYNELIELLEHNMFLINGELNKCSLILLHNLFLEPYVELSKAYYCMRNDSKIKTTKRTYHHVFSYSFFDRLSSTKEDHFYDSHIIKISNNLTVSDYEDLNNLKVQLKTSLAELVKLIMVFAVKDLKDARNLISYERPEEPSNKLDSFYPFVESTLFKIKYHRNDISELLTLNGELLDEKVSDLVKEFCQNNENFSLQFVNPQCTEIAFSRTTFFNDLSEGKIPIKELHNEVNTNNMQVLQTIELLKRNSQNEVDVKKIRKMGEIENKGESLESIIDVIDSDLKERILKMANTAEIGAANMVLNSTKQSIQSGIGMTKYFLYYSIMLISVKCHIDIEKGNKTPFYNTDFLPILQQLQKQIYDSTKIKTAAQLLKVTAIPITQNEIDMYEIGRKCHNIKLSQCLKQTFGTIAILLTNVFVGVMQNIKDTNYTKLISLNELCTWDFELIQNICEEIKVNNDNNTDSKLPSLKDYFPNLNTEDHFPLIIDQEEVNSDLLFMIKNQQFWKIENKLGGSISEQVDKIQKNMNNSLVKSKKLTQKDELKMLRAKVSELNSKLLLSSTPIKTLPSSTPSTSIVSNYKTPVKAFVMLNTEEMERLLIANNLNTTEIDIYNQLVNNSLYWNHEVVSRKVATEQLIEFYTTTSANIIQSDLFNFTECLSLYTLKCLAPRTWLNDSIINAFIGLINDDLAKQCNNCQTVSMCTVSFFSTLFMDGDELRSDEQLLRYLSKLIQKTPLPDKTLKISSLSKFGTIRNINNIHWEMFGFDFENETIVYSQSMGNVSEKSVGKVTRLLCRILLLLGVSDVSDETLKNWKIVRWNFIQQPNDYDCGPCALMYLIIFLYNLTYLNTNYTSNLDKFRNKILCSIVYNQLYLSNLYIISELNSIDNILATAKSYITQIDIIESSDSKRNKVISESKKNKSDQQVKRIDLTGADDSEQEKNKKWEQQQSPILIYDYLISFLENEIKKIGLPSISGFPLINYEELLDLLIIDSVNNFGISNVPLDHIINDVKNIMFGFFQVFVNMFAAIIDKSDTTRQLFTFRSLTIPILFGKEDALDIYEDNNGYSFYQVVSALPDIMLHITSMSKDFQFKYMAAKQLISLNIELSKSLKGTLEELLLLLTYYDENIQVISYNKTLSEYVLINGNDSKPSSLFSNNDNYCVSAIVILVKDDFKFTIIDNVKETSTFPPGTRSKDSVDLIVDVFMGWFENKEIDKKNDEMNVLSEYLECLTKSILYEESSAFSLKSKCDIMVKLDYIKNESSRSCEIGDNNKSNELLVMFDSFMKTLKIGN